MQVVGKGYPNVENYLKDSDFCAEYYPISARFQRHTSRRHLPNLGFTLPRLFNILKPKLGPGVGPFFLKGWGSLIIP